MLCEHIHYMLIIIHVQTLRTQTLLEQSLGLLVCVAPSLFICVCKHTHCMYVSTHIIYIYMLYTKRMSLEQSVGLLCASLSLSQCMYANMHMVCKHIHYTHVYIAYSKNVARAECGPLGVHLSLSMYVCNMYANIYVCASIYI